MKADTTGETEPTGGAKEAADPFAVDLFAASHARAVGGAAVAASGGEESFARAADLPGARGGQGVRAGERAGAYRAAWHASLPRLSRREAQFSSMVAGLPQSLSTRALAICARVVGRLMSVADGEASFETVDLREVNLDEWAAQRRAGEAAPRVYVLTAIEPESTELAVELEAGFASALTARMLGETQAAPDSLRSVSKIERSILEFLFLTLLHELNEAAGAPLLRLASVTDSLPAYLAAMTRPQMSRAQASSGQPRPQAASAQTRATIQTGQAGQTGQTAQDENAAGRNPRGMLASVRVSVGQVEGVARIVFDAAALAALDGRRNPLLSDGRRDARDAGSSADSGFAGNMGDAARGRLARFKRLTETTPLALLVGETELSAQDLAGLESGDVVLVEKPFVNLRARRMGEVRVRAGEGLSVLIAGEAAAGESQQRGADSSVASSRAGGGGAREESSRAEAREDLSGAREGSEAGAIRLRVRSISVEAGARADAERLSMEEEAAGMEAGTEDAGVLEGLLLSIRVEMAARRITLDELARLRPGQVLELGCRATDPVELIIDGRRIATGELVDIEGQLGVRITRLSS